MPIKSEIKKYPFGTEITIKTIYKAQDAYGNLVPTTPPNPVTKIIDPDGEQIELSLLSTPAEGIILASFIANKAGIWRYRGESLDTIVGGDEWMLEVLPTQFV